MSEFFKSTRNTRSIVEGSFSYLRSDVPIELSEDERLWLLNNRVITVIDLRTEVERERKRCPLINDERFCYRLFPIRGGDAIPKSPDEVSKSYINMVDEGFERLVDFILNLDGGVLYFCNAGKDRTGVLSAVLLHKLGKDRDYIIKDYIKSKDNLRQMLTDYVKSHPEVDAKVITPTERYIEEFLDWYTDRGRR